MAALAETLAPQQEFQSVVHLSFVPPFVENLGELSEQQPERHLRLVPPLPPELAPRFIAADSIPDIAAGQYAAEQEAHEILESSMQTLRDGRFDEVQPVIDALGTARRVIEAPRNSPERLELTKGLVLDCKRLLGEAKRSLKPEVFPRSKHDYDQEEEDLLSHGMTIGGMVRNSLTAVAEPELKEIRIAEAKEHGTFRTIGRLIMGKGIEIKPVADEVHTLTVSQCIDEAIEEFVRNPKSNKYAGYVPRIQKLMVRGMIFDRVEQCAYQEQIALPGLFITNDIINEAYQIMGVTEAGTRLTKPEILAKQVVTEGEFDLMEFVELVDVLASQKSGKNIFMGEAVRVDHAKDYSKVREEAAKRYDWLDDDAHTLALAVLGLAEAGVDAWAADKIVADKVKAMLLEEVRKDPSKALEMFDEATMKGAQAAHALEARGDTVAADALWAEVMKKAPPAGYCGAGDSCGLEGVGATSAEGSQAIALGLDANDASELIHDTQRACPDCRELRVYYDKHGNKACTGCGKTDIKVHKTGDKQGRSK